MRGVLRYSAILMASLILTGVVAGAPLLVTPHINLQATPLLRKIVNSALSNLVTTGEVEGQTLGAARNQLVTLDQEGNITSSASIPIEQPVGVSAYTTGRAIIGDCGNNTVISVDIRSGQSARVLDLRATDYGNLVAGDVVRSGGFVDNMQNDKSFISAACMWNEKAHRADLEYETYDGVKYHHGEYNYYVISALAGKTMFGAAGNADSSDDGKISAEEMHTFMAARENQPEHPQIWDFYGVGAAFLVR